MKHRTLFISLALTLLATVGGCVGSPTTGSLVLHDFEDRELRILLRHYCGLVIRNEGTYDEPIPVVVLARAVGTIDECRTHAELAAALDRSPGVGRWVRYEKCTAPLSAGISEEWLDGAFQLFTDRGMRVEPDEFIYCTCL